MNTCRRSTAALIVAAAFALTSHRVAGADEPGPVPPAGTQDTAPTAAELDITGAGFASSVDGRPVVIVAGTPVVAGRILVYTDEQYLYSTMRPLLLAAGASEVIELGPKEMLAETSEDPAAMAELLKRVADVDHVVRAGYDQFIPPASAVAVSDDTALPWWTYLAGGVAAASMSASVTLRRTRRHDTQVAAHSSNPGDEDAASTASRSSNGASATSRTASGGDDVRRDEEPAGAFMAADNAASAELSDPGAS